MTWSYFKDELVHENIKRLADKYGFKYQDTVEKFILNYEIFGHIQEILSPCVIKGGMAVPFHLSSESVMRLSVDIDMITDNSKDDVIKAVDKISEKLKDMVIIGKPYKPEHKEVDLPLLTYYCKYITISGINDELKLEIFYKNPMNISTYTVNQKAIFGLLMRFPVQIYDHGSLIGDKLTTLAFNTIGIPLGDRGQDVPKQIYDIACLLKAAPDAKCINGMIKAFQTVSREEISYMNNDLTLDDVQKDISSFSDQLLDNYRLNDPQNGRYSNFQSEVLGGNSYRRDDHVSDIMLVQLITNMMLQVENNHTDKIIGTIRELNGMFKLEPPDKNKMHKKLIESHKKHSRDLKAMTPDQAFIHARILDNSNP